MANIKEMIIEVDGKKIPLTLVKPTHEELLSIDMEYRKIYSMAVREGVITTAEALKKYKEVGAWDKEDEEKVSEMMFSLSLLGNVIKNEDGSADEDQRRDAALKATKLRAELLQKINTRTSLLEQTAEQMAEEQKIHKYILLCCRTEEDERFFDSREGQQQFANNNREQMSAIYREAYFFDYDLPEDVSEQWEEVKYIKEITAKEEAKLKEEKEEKEKPKAKKKGRPKKAKTEVK